MKRLIFMLCAIFMCFLAACGTKKENPVSVTPQNDETKIEETASVEDVKDEEKDSTEIAADVEKKEDETVSETEATIEETVLVDQDGYKITANSLEYKGSRVILNVTLENNTEDDLSFLCGTNGYSMNTINNCVIEAGYLNCDVSAGMKAKEKIYFDKSTLSLCGIKEIGEIGLAIYVENSDSDVIYKSDLIAIPTSLHDKIDYSEDTIKKSIEENWEKELSMEIVYSNTDFLSEVDDVKISSVVIASSPYDAEDKLLFLELENTSDHSVKYTSSNIVINGMNISSGTWDTYCIAQDKRSLIYFNLAYLLDDEYKSIISPEQIGSFSFDFTEREFESHDEIKTSNVSILIDDSLTETESAGKLIYESDTVNINLLPVTEDEYGMYYLISFFVENKTDKDISLHNEFNSLSLNGYMIDGLGYSCDVSPMGKGILSLEVYKNSAEEVDINNAADILSGTCKFELRDKNYHKTDTISLEFDYQ